MEEMEQRKKEKEAATTAGVNPTTASYTPDYAVGLVSPAPTVSMLYYSVLYSRLRCRTGIPCSHSKYVILLLKQIDIVTVSCDNHFLSNIDEKV
jgi:hypothetical protein